MTSASDDGVHVRVVDHPLTRAWLSILRDQATDNTAFRSALARLSQMLVYEAFADVDVDEIDVQTPVAVAPARGASMPLGLVAGARLDPGPAGPADAGRRDGPPTLSRRWCCR